MTIHLNEGIFSPEETISIELKRAKPQSS